MKHRTKEQKIRAKLRKEKQIMEYSYEAPEATGAVPTRSAVDSSVSSLKTVQKMPPAQIRSHAHQVTAKDLFSYDTNLIMKDLRKTILVAGSIFILLFVIYAHFMGIIKF
jgi:hypothetical protein